MSSNFIASTTDVAMRYLLSQENCEAVLYSYVIYLSEPPASTSTASNAVAELGTARASLLKLGKAAESVFLTGLSSVLLSLVLIILL